MDAPAPDANGPFVLVHGGWHGGWCWSRVLPRLRAGGRQAHAPTLSGLGERAHLLTREVSRDTHVRDLVALLDDQACTTPRWWSTATPACWRRT